MEKRRRNPAGFGKNGQAEVAHAERVSLQLSQWRRVEKLVSLLPVLVSLFRLAEYPDVAIGHGLLNCRRDLGYLQALAWTNPQ